MSNPTDTSKGPGVYIPPPLFYVLIFLAAMFIQKKIPLDNALFQLQVIKIAGVILLVVALFFSYRSLRQFFLSKNTLIPIKPASSLQTTGIYRISRNPMYVGISHCIFRTNLPYRQLVESYFVPLTFSNCSGVYY